MLFCPEPEGREKKTEFQRPAELCSLGDLPSVCLNGAKRNAV